MFNLEARIEAIVFQQFLYIIKKYDSPFYCFSVYWLKFHLNVQRSKSFNIIANGNDVDRPRFYEFMIKVVKEIKSIDQDYIKNVKKILK